MRNHNVTSFSWRASKCKSDFRHVSCAKIKIFNSASAEVMTAGFASIAGGVMAVPRIPSSSCRWDVGPVDPWRFGITCFP